MNLQMEPLDQATSGRAVERRSGAERRAGGDRRNRPNRRRNDLLRELGRPDLLDLRDSTERRSGQERRRRRDRRQAGEGMITPWQLPDRP